ncbi:MAG: hypothetical protein EGQ76_03695 [Sutterella sp.]|nr:hypothetical protein [Sutterella sp.]
MVQGTPGQTRPQKPWLLRESLHRVSKPRAFKRGLFSTWLRGYIQERLEFYCRRYGVTLVSVNPAYTSTTCPHCGCVDKRNRHGDSFKCTYCGWSGHSDRVAAANLVSRDGDEKLARKLGRQYVKAELEARFRRRLEEPSGSTVHGRTSAGPQGPGCSDTVPAIHTGQQFGCVGTKSE